MEQMYQLLMGLPLFSGVTCDKMLEIIGNTKFHFLKYSPGEVFITEGEQCSHIKFIISGKARFAISDRSRSMTVSQTLSAPDVIAPEYIFGRSTAYPCSVTALEPVGVLQISKAEYLKILNSDSIFLINYLNMLSMNAQKAVDGLLSIVSGSVERRLALWIVSLTQAGGSDIVLSCNDCELPSLFGDVDRKSFFLALENMKSRGLIDYAADHINVLSRRELVELLGFTVQ